MKHPPHSQSLTQTNLYLLPNRTVSPLLLNRMASCLRIKMLFIDITLTCFFSRSLEDKLHKRVKFLTFFFVFYIFQILKKDDQWEAVAVAFKEKENAVIRANDLLEETKWVQLLLVVEGRGLCYFRHTSTSFTWWYRFHYEGYNHMFFVRRKARDGHWHICIPHGFGVVVCGSVPWVLAGCRPRCIQLCLFTTIRIMGSQVFIFIDTL